MNKLAAREGAAEEGRDNDDLLYGFVVKNPVIGASSASQEPTGLLLLLQTANPHDLSGVTQ